MADERIFFLHPNAHWGGCLTAVARENALPRVAELERAPQLRIYRVRATIADAVPLVGDLPDLLRSTPFERVRLQEDPLLMHLHHGGWNAVYYRLVGAADTHLLDYIEVRVKTVFPRAAFDFGRTAINHLLDSLVTVWDLPMVIARLDLLTTEAEDVLISELFMPFATKLEMGPLGGMDQAPLFAPWLATWREAMTATSPYWRLLCAWRVYDGISDLRRRIKKTCERLGITAPRFDLLAAGRAASASRRSSTSSRRRRRSISLRIDSGISTSASVRRTPSAGSSQARAWLVCEMADRRLIEARRVQASTRATR